MCFNKIISAFFLYSLIFTGVCKAQEELRTDGLKDGLEGHHHNRYELEISENNELHVEFTGSVYFLPQKKVQVTAEDSFHHFAMMVVQELPLGHSKWGTFAGFGSTYGFERTEHQVQGHTETEVEHEWSLVVQSGLAYSFDNHWSTGFTFSPGWNLHYKKPVAGLTLDLVYGF